MPQGLAGLSPANFGMVMATGIVSIAAQMLGRPGVAQALLALNVVMYAVLWLLTLLRLARHRRRFLDDLTDHLRGPGFFTTVAGTAVLGSQCWLVAGPPGAAPAVALCVLAAVLWLLLIYGILAIFTLKAHKPSLETGINGAWLLAVVATQSIAVLAELLSTRVDPHVRLEMSFLALALWLWGGMLYIWMISLIFYRYTFFPLSPSELTPPYWINMGAMAISTLAGTLLVKHAPQTPLLQSLLPFIKGFTLFYWATGSWWIPMLLVLGVWRYVIRRYPLRYDPTYWAAVFPLGMYAVCTLELAQVLELDFLQDVPVAFGIAAGLAWLTAFGGLLARLVGVIQRR